MHTKPHSTKGNAPAVGAAEALSQSQSGQKGKEAMGNTSTTTSVFNFGKFPVRIMQRNGEPWFVATDVCTALEYANPSKAVADHLDDDERYNQSLDRGGKLTLISESGLYALVLRSRKPEARKFAKWVTSEVLPAIRKQGYYTHPESKAGECDHLLTSAQCRKQAATLAFDYLDACRDGVRTGVFPKWDESGAIDIGTAMGAAILQSHRWMMTVSPSGELSMVAMPFQVCMVDPHSSESLSAVIREAVPYELIPQVLEAVTRRVSAKQQQDQRRIASNVK